VFGGNGAYHEQRDKNVSARGKSFQVQLLHTASNLCCYVSLLISGLFKQNVGHSLTFSSRKAFRETEN